MATFATERLLVGMDEDMRFELIRIGKSRGTTLARVRTFAGVYPEMSSEISHLYELPIAMFAMIRSLARMQSHMGLQMVIARKSLMAFGTFERFLAGMRPFVILQDVFVAEGAITNAARELFIFISVFADVATRRRRRRRGRRG